MESLPLYINIVFIFTTLLTVVLLYKATNLKLIIIAIIWLILQAIVSLTGFYAVTSGTPPRFGLLLLPPVLFIIMLFVTKAGRATMDGFNLKGLTILHIIRVPVELTLYWLFLCKTIPIIMTFEGRNFDILCGLTAPLVYYFGYVKPLWNKKILLAWNIVCLLLVINIVITALLSAPFDFQKFGFEQPNIALLYFPFIWLPCLIVPAVLLAHLVAIRRLINVKY